MELPDKSAGVPTPNPGKPKIEQVVTGAVLVKRPATRRFKDFIMQESPKIAAKRIGRELLWPQAKAAAEQSFNAFVHAMFWGGGQTPPISQIVRGTVLRSQTQTYPGTAPSGYQPGLAAAMQANVSRPGGQYQDVVSPTSQQAEKLLAGLLDALARYHVVTVADLYEGAGLPTQISDQAYGWTDLTGARISPVSNGFVLELPRPVII